MFIEIILNTVLLPLIFGVTLCVATLFFKKYPSSVVLICGLLALGIYLMLEGIPSLPPVSSKHKVAILIAGFIAIIFVASLSGLTRLGLSSLLLFGTLIWLGWNRLSDSSMLPQFSALIVLISLATYSPVKFDWQKEGPLVWPITLLCLAIGGSIISLLSAYIGFAQALGALAAFVGGYILVAYGLMILRPNKTHITFSEAVNQVILLSMVTLLLVVGLFAPEISPVALAVLGLTLLVPLFHTRFDGINSLLKPILIGLLAAIPTSASIAIAAL